jgi:hypothetical protein
MGRVTNIPFMPLITLVDHLRMVGSKGATGCLKVTRGDGPCGEIFVENGAIVYASVPDMTCGLHTVAVMVTWDPVEIDWQEGIRPPSRPFQIAVPDLIARIAVVPGESPYGAAHAQRPLGPTTAREDLEPAQTVRPQHWCLELVNTDRQGMRLALDRREIRIGRGRDNDITILHQSISRDHCMFYVEGDRIRVLDLGSSNGTIVDGKPVTEALLSSGCEIHLGTCQFRLTYERPGVARATTPVLLFDAGSQATEQKIQQHTEAP